MIPVHKKRSGLASKWDGVWLGAGYWLTNLEPHASNTWLWGHTNNRDLLVIEASFWKSQIFPTKGIKCFKAMVLNIVLRSASPTLLGTRYKYIYPAFTQIYSPSPWSWQGSGAIAFHSIPGGSNSHWYPRACGLMAHGKECHTSEIIRRFHSPIT